MIDFSLSCESFAQESAKDTHPIVDVAANTTQANHLLTYLQSQNAVLRTQLHERTLNYNDLLRRYSQLQRLFSATEINILEVLDDLDKFAKERRQNEGLETKLHENRRLLHDLKENFHRVDHERQHLQQALVQTEQELKKNTETLHETAKAALNKKDKLINELKHELDELRAEIGKVRRREMASRQALDETNQTLSDRMKISDEERSFFATEARRLEAEIASLKEALKDKELDVDHGVSRTEYDTIIGTLKAELEHLSKENERLLSLNEQVQQDLAALTARVIELTQRLPDAPRIQKDQDIQVCVDDMKVDLMTEQVLQLKAALREAHQRQAIWETEKSRMSNLLQEQHANEHRVGHSTSYEYPNEPDRPKNSSPRPMYTYKNCSKLWFSVRMKSAN